MYAEITRLLAAYDIAPTGSTTNAIDLEDPSAALQIHIAKSKMLRKRQVTKDKTRAVSGLWEQWHLEFDKHREEVSKMFQQRNPPLGCAPGGVLVAQLSDLHFGALVQTPGAVGYDMRIASKRLRLYAIQVIRQQIATGADRLVVALTGDLIDSLNGKDHLDKILQSDGPQHLAMMQGADLIISFIKEIQDLEIFGSMMVAGITGNESRATKNVCFGEKGAAENLDCGLNAVIARQFQGSDVETSFELFRNVIQVGDQKVLLIHGHTLEKNMNQANLHGLLTEHGCNFGLSGHVHFAYTTSEWARSASLVGPDGYSENGLLLFSGRATQNLIHFQGQNRNVMIVDLHECAAIEGYPLATYSGAYGASNEQRWHANYDNGR